MKFRFHSYFLLNSQSRPARALWIEIAGKCVRRYQMAVEAREGLVD